MTVLRRLSVPLAAGTLALALAGCGDSGNADDAPDGSGSPSASETTTDTTDDAEAGDGEDAGEDAEDTGSFAAEDYCSRIDAAATRKVVGKGAELTYHAPGESYELYEGLPQESAGHECLANGPRGLAYLVVRTDGSGVEELEALHAGGYGPPSVGCQPESLPDGLPDGSAAGFCEAGADGPVPIPDAIVVIGQRGTSTFTCTVSVPPGGEFTPAVRDQALAFCGEAAEAATA